MTVRLGRARGGTAAVLVVVLGTACAGRAAPEQVAQAPAAPSPPPVPSAAPPPTPPPAPAKPVVPTAAPAPTADPAFCSAVTDFAAIFTRAFGGGTPVPPDQLRQDLAAVIAATDTAAATAPSPRAGEYFAINAANARSLDAAYAAVGYDGAALDPATVTQVRDQLPAVEQQAVLAEVAAACPDVAAAG